MADRGPWRWWGLFKALPPDSKTKACIVALVVSLVAAVLVSSVAVRLRPLQQANLQREREARITEMVSRAIGVGGALVTQVIDLDTGQPAPENVPVPDPTAGAADPKTSVALPKAVDIAGIGHRAKYATVFLRREAGKTILIVLPVYGSGYQSTLYGYLALRGDARTVAALTFYRQEETPGLGARITDSDWQALWPGKQLTDENGTVRIDVVKGTASGPYQVDGITGATRTSTGVRNLLHFWLGEHGFGRYLARVRNGGK